MRATSPMDALGPTLAYEAIPQPKLPVGTQLDITKASSYNLEYYLRHIPRELVRVQRAAMARMKAHGYFPEVRGKKLLPSQKQALRDKFEFMRTADGVFIAGHQPSEMQSHDSIANQCYLKGGSGFSGMSYQCFVMFRKLVDGKQLIYTLPFPLMSEQQAGFCRMPEPVNIRKMPATGI